MPKKKRKARSKRTVTKSRRPKKTEPAARGSLSSRSIGLRAVVVLTCLIVLVALGRGAWELVGPRANSRIVFPPPRAETVADEEAVAFDDFVGSEACIECHEEQHDLWLGSTHQRAGGVPSPEIVIAPFDGQPIRFRDAVVFPSVTEDGAYIFTVEQGRRDPVVFRVDGVIGGGHMVGGGTQGFVSMFPDRKVRFLPFDFIREEAVWFCNSAGRFVSITEQTSVWTGRPIGSLEPRDEMTPARSVTAVRSFSRSTRRRAAMTRSS